MTPFLKQVADYYFPLEDFSSRVFVFPNRRSSAFFRKAVCECAARSGCAALLPECTTIGDLFASLSSVRLADRIPLLVRLYEVYSGIYARMGKSVESLDEFICWGDVLLSDFNDVDKYLVDPRQIFTNVADLKNIEDDFSYLSENQRKAIEEFVRNFVPLNSSEDGSQGSRRYSRDGKELEIKASFLKIWNILLELYTTFNSSLRADSLGYEGMIYREVASLDEGVREKLGDKKYVFVGLNALNECEKALMNHLRDARQAEFCWDWSSEWIRDPQNRSSHFMEQNVKAYPNRDFRPDRGAEGLAAPKFNLVSVPSSVGQAKQLPFILNKLGLTKAKRESEPELSVETLTADEAKPATPDLIETAIVLPDEKMLLPVLNSIPTEIGEINITMGYPLSGSELCALMRLLGAAQANTITKDGKTYFYHRPVRSAMSSGIFRTIASEADRKVCSEILKSKYSYICSEDFASSPLLSRWFTPLGIDFKQPSSEAVSRLADYQKDVLSSIGAALAPEAAAFRDSFRRGGSWCPEDGKTREEESRACLDASFAKSYFTAVQQLQALRLEIRPSTYLRLLDCLLGSVAVPFNGEPLKGLQIMGPLETRALDFRNLIILSCNEGVFPRKSFTSSFIPPELRRGFALPTYEWQDAVWAYYFYRMIQRAENVWMLYDSRTEGLNSGEVSRYVKQLEYLYNVAINRFVTSPPTEVKYTEKEIEKKEEDLARLKENEFRFSATSLKNYLSCPAKFYYGCVLGLSDQAESVDNLDNGTLGTVFHAVMQWIYTVPGTDKKPVGMVDRAFLDGKLSAAFAPRLREKIDAEICKAIRCVEVRGKDIVLRSVIEEYVRKTLEYEKKVLEKKGRDHFTVLALEQNFPFEIFGYPFKGFIDRVDSFDDGSVRVVDYKSGRVDDKEFWVMGKEGTDDEGARRVFDAVFRPDVKDRPDIALQFFIYNLMLTQNKDGQKLLKGRGISNSVYSVSRIFSGDYSEYSLPQEVRDYALNLLHDTLDEIYDTADSPTFRRTALADTCANCDFKIICGR